MTIISATDVLNITNSYNGTAFARYRDMSVYLQEVRKRLHTTWTESLDSSGGSDKGPAYSVYTDPEYNFEAIHCFEKSKQCTREAVKYFMGEVLGTRTGALYQGKAPSELSVLDVYNGNGLTTVHLNLNGFNAESFNDCPEQVKYMHHAAKVLASKDIVNHTALPTKQYDVVVSLEVLEHYSEPLVHLKDLLQIIKPGGYLVESSGFNGSSKNIGHFDSYRIFDWKMSFMKARQLTTKVMKHYFELEHAGFNCAPRIWRRKLTDPGLPFTPDMAVGKCWEMHPMHYGANSKVYVMHKGEVYTAPVDLLIDNINKELSTAGKPTLFEDPHMFACCSGPRPEFTKLSDTSI